MATSNTLSGSIAPTMPMQRASSTSLGLRSSCPPGQSTIGHSPGGTWKRSSRALASASWSESSTMRGWPLRARKPSSRRTSGWPAGPTITGPPPPLLDQAHPAQDQGAHDPLAEFGLADQQGAQPFGTHHQGVHGSLGAGVDQRRAAGELGQLAHERPGRVGDDGLADAPLVAAGDGDLAAEDHGQAMAGLADPHQGLARRIGPRLAEPPQPVDLGGRQGRIHLVAAGDDGGPGRRHRASSERGVRDCRHGSRRAATAFAANQREVAR